MVAAVLKHPARLPVAATPVVRLPVVALPVARLRVARLRAALTLAVWLLAPAVFALPTPVVLTSLPAGILADVLSTSYRVCLVPKSHPSAYFEWPAKREIWRATSLLAQLCARRL